MTDEKKLIVYQLCYDNQNFWAYVSNFLNKFYKKEKMNRAEVSKTSTRVIKDSRQNPEIVRNILNEKEKFRAISKPEKLYEVDDRYESLVCIYIEASKLIEIVDLHKLYMIFRSFEKERMLIIIEGVDKDYYAISHFVEWVNEHNEQFYNSVYFYNTEENKKTEKAGKTGKSSQIKRMRRKKAYAFERLLPLLEIDGQTDKLLRTLLKDMAGDDEIRAIYDTDVIKVERIDLKNSALRQLNTKKELFVNCKEDELISVLRNINLLTLILFADSLIRQSKPYNNIMEVNKSIYILKRHAQGYLQLTENILFHTKAQMGTFCFRLLDGSNKYLWDKYHMSEEEKKLPFFEICISDYSGDENCGNLAQTFFSKLKDAGMQRKFKKIKPVHFFQENEEMDKEIQAAWRSYYDDVDNIGSHYGLKIFKTLVQRSGGKFIMESHSTHVPGSGEYLGVKGEDDFCMPGTFYSILMPVNFEEAQVKEQELDFGIANVVDYENDINRISNIQLSYSDSAGMKSPYYSMAEKRAIVDGIKNGFGARSKKDRIIAIDAEGIPEKNAELIYKAIIKTARDADTLKYIAFYNCMPEFVSGFWDVAYSLFKTSVIDYVLGGKELQIILFCKDDYEELIIIPGNYDLTLQLNNQINFTKETKWKGLFLSLNYSNEERTEYAGGASFKILPFDAIVKITQDGETLSIFEHYTRGIVDRNIQQELLGCKFEDTHMRLGSAIHVGQFYEAELLFGINLFVERFALLIALDLKKKLGRVKRLTLYGYAAYSEQLIYKLRSLLKLAYSGMDIDYAILERETEERGNKHTDKIRYSTYIEDENKQRKYFKDRKIVTIIPISSTLKTSERLINMFCEANGEGCRNNILEDYEVILVGNRENNYWNIGAEHRINNKQSTSMKWKPRFLIRFDMDYEESLECRMCFPEHIIDELPLIEVNAASTIPNQAFGIQRTDLETRLCTMEEIKALEKEMRILEDCFLYSHTKNGDAHFLFYIQPNQLIMKRRHEIEEWLRKKKGELEPDAETYNVIFCPSHTRNVGFAECINEVVFDSSAVIIHDDVDKEYRSNFFTKYSNIYLFVKKIAEEKQERKIRFFYADDCLLTGRSIQRAKSLLKSVIKEVFHDTRMEYCIFDSIFVLVDRNSDDNRRMYAGDRWEEHFFAFCSLHISSLRNHGDSCVLCNLENDAANLKRSSASDSMYKYWEGQQYKFRPDTIEEFIESDDYKDDEKRKRAFRRLICANEAGVFLKESCHGNYKENAMRCILQLILNGCNRWEDGEFEIEVKKELQREYFLSYCKILSRPFVIFNKAVKEAVFDFLLIFTEKVLKDISIGEVVKATERKVYLQNENTIKMLSGCEDLIDDIFDEKETKLELLNVLLKQLTELKSNYIIRLENINRIAEYVKNSDFSQEERNAFYERYMVQVKKLLGVSSDTSKSAWFDYLLSKEKEYSGGESGEIELPDDIYERLYIENNRVVSDAVVKLCQKVEFSEEEKVMMNARNLLDANIVTADEYEQLSVFEKVKIQDQNLKLSQTDEGLIGNMADKMEIALNSYLLKDYNEVLNIHMNHAGDKSRKEQLKNRRNLLPLAAQILLYQYIDDNFGEHTTKEGSSGEGHRTSYTEQGNQLAIYLNYILDAEQTYILAETVSEADEWEDNIIGEFNELVLRANKNRKLVLELKNRKEYLMLGNSKSGNGSMIFNSRESLEEISVKEEFKKHGYYISGQDFGNDDNVLVWKLGTQNNQVYVYSRLKSDRKDLNNIRNALQFSYLLNSRVFTGSNTEFFTELIAAVKDLSYSLGEKTISHTPYMIRMQQYLQFIENTDAEQNGQVYEDSQKWDIVMLLADLNISDHYRESLRRGYYIRNTNFVKARWDEPNSVFADGFPCRFIVPIGELQKRIEITVNNNGFKFRKKLKSGEIEYYEEGKIMPEDELICPEEANASREIVLMLYLMIANAAKEGRGETKDSKIEVFLSKTAEGEIRISNKLKSSYTGNRNTVFLEVPPYNEEGISVWTVSRYLKSFAAITLNKALAELKKKETKVTVRELERLKDEICALPKLVKVNIEDEIYVDGDRYFSIVLPLLAQKYKEWF